MKRLGSTTNTNLIKKIGKTSLMLSLLSLGASAFANDHHTSYKTQLQHEKSSLLNTLHQHLPLAPARLAGSEMSLSITSASSDITDVFPNKGAIIQRFDRRGVFTSTGTGGQHHIAGEGVYRTKRIGRNSIEVSAQINDEHMVTRYEFTGVDRGTWERHLNNAQAIIKGEFRLSHQADADIAPDSLEGMYVSLKI